MKNTRPHVRRYKILRILFLAIGIGLIGLSLIALQWRKAADFGPYFLIASAISLVCAYRFDVKYERRRYPGE